MALQAVLNLHMLERRGLVLYFPYSTSFGSAPRCLRFDFGVMFLLMPWNNEVDRHIIPQILESGHWTIVVPMLCLDMHWNNEVDRHIFVGTLQRS